MGADTAALTPESEPAATDEAQLVDETHCLAFDAVHDAFNGRLYNFLARLSNRRNVAEDLLEETWLRLVKHARRLRPDTRLGPWLFTVARHVHASYCRSRLLEDSHASGLMGLWPNGRSGPSPFEAVEASGSPVCRRPTSETVTFSRQVVIGVAESLVPLFFGFGCLTVAWLCVTLGLWRRP